MKEIEVNYIDWKINVNNKGLDYKSYYDGGLRLIAFDGPLIYKCRLNPDDESDYNINMITNETGRLGNKLDPLASTANLFFRGTGIKKIATGGAVTNLDYPLTADRKINCTQLILKNQTIDDHITFQIIHPNPVIGVLNEFATEWNVSEDKQDQGIVEIPYPAQLVTGLIIRVIYSSAGSTDVNVNINFWLHEDTTL